MLVTEEDVRKYIGKLKGYIKDPLCKEQVKFALSQFVHQVENGFKIKKGTHGKPQIPNRHAQKRIFCVYENIFPREQTGKR